MLTVIRDNAVLRLTLNRPEVKNALDDRLIAALIGELSRPDDAIRVVVIRGSGGAFCAGADLNMMRAAGHKSMAENERDALEGPATLFRLIADYPALVISAIEGPCFGGGGGIVAASDLAIASESAKFSFSEVKLGLVPATISPYVLEKIGPGHARQLFMTGEIFDVSRAERIGLVHQVTTAAEIDAVIEKRIAAQLAVAPAAAVLCKTLARGTRLDLAESARLLAEVRGSAEAAEGLAAFLEKRKPEYAV
jgi:enoyl-CoA hydratase/carnithine racemase